MRLRLIPVVIVLAALGLSFRAGAIFDLLMDQESSTKAPVIGLAIAQDASAVPPVPGDNGKEMTPLELDQSDVPIVDGTETMHPTEARLANSLAQRRAELDARERELEQRTAMLGVVESRLADTQKNLEGIRDEIKQLVAKYEGLEDEESARLQRVYSNMKPKKAAAIFDTMELDTILSVIRGMSDRKLAPILEAMDPNKAVIVTQEIDAREELPTFSN
jgi:flagellar motility protein MotE (MotC chaperone)